jgi:hypothetical protein
MAQTHSVKRKRRTQGPELIIALVFIGAAIVLMLLLAFTATRQPAQSQLDGDVVTGRAITAVHAMGDGPPIPFLPQDGPQPNVSVAEAAYDFGRIGAKDVVSHTFYLRNTGDAPLTISRAYTTCGCTTAEISADVIPPGKAVTAELRFDAGFHDSAGQTVRRGLIIESNDPDQPQAEIWVQAEVGK